MQQLRTSELLVTLRDGKLPFRPKLQGKPDAGAEEIQSLYYSAFVNGNPLAGLELGRLYRSGFPKDRPSDVIPKNPEIAVDLLWNTMDRVRQARPTSPESNPMVEVFAAFELLAMQDGGEAKRSDRSELINEDQLGQLREYGDRSTLKYMNFREAVILGKGDLTVTCNSEAFTKTLAIWSWKRSISPTDPQFEWFERVYNCRESDPKAEKRKASEKAGKDKQAEAPEKQGLKKVREFYKKQYEAWVKERDAAEKKKDDAKDKPRSFTDKIAELLGDDSGKRRRR